MCNRDFLSKDLDDVIEYLNNRSKPSGIYHLREEDNLKAQLNLVTRKLEALETKDNRFT